MYNPRSIKASPTENRMSSKADIESLPVNREFYTVLDGRIYKRSKKRIVALCVLESRYGTELKNLLCV